MSDIKYIYFDLRVKGEPARLLLAHGGVKYTDERIELGWNDPKPWTELKPTMPWGQLPMLQWKGEPHQHHGRMVVPTQGPMGWIESVEHLQDRFP